jgi:hypothetical protein
MIPGDRTERREVLHGFPVRIITYRLESTWYSTVDNVEPGARIARAEGPTRDEVEAVALEDAARRLERTRRHPV